MSYADLFGSRPALKSAQKLGQEFTPRPDEAVILAVTKLWLMYEDLQGEEDITPRYLKYLIFANLTESFSEVLDHDAATWSSTLPDSAKGQIAALKETRSADAWRDLCSDLSLIQHLWDTLTDRDRCLLLGLELVAFSPWGNERELSFNDELRDDRLEFFAENVAGPIERKEILDIDSQLRDELKRVRKPFRNWRQLGMLAAGGVVAGAVTGGLAAAAVGSAIGGTMGLSGAAATSAGLALLGGGSLASGGAGMAGGVALVSAVGAGAGAGAGLGGGALAGSRPNDTDVALDAAKLIVLTDRVILGTQQSKTKARAILKALRSRLSAVEGLRDRVGGSDKTDSHPDELTRIAVVLEKTVARVDELVDPNRAVEAARRAADAAKRAR